MNHILHVPVPYEARVRFGRARDLTSIVLRRDLPVSIREVEVERAPIAVSMRGRHSPPVDLDWRTVDGRLFRPLLDNGGHPVSVSGFPQAVQQALQRQNDYWADYPVDAGGRGIQSAAADLEGIYDTAKLVSDVWLEASVRATQRFEQDLVVIDGVIHKASPPPVWSPGAGSAAMTYGLHRISLIVPGLEEPSCVRFRGDQVEQASEFALLLAGRADQFPAGTLPPKAKALEIDPGAVTIIDPELVPDPRSDSFKAAADAIRVAMAPAVLGETEFALLAAYVDVQRGAAALPVLKPAERDIASCEAVLQAYLAAYRDHGDTGWPRGAQSQEFALCALALSEVLGPPAPVEDHDLTGLGI